MSDKIKIFLEIETDNIDLVKNSFDILQQYIFIENNINNLNSSLIQAYPLLKTIITHPETNLEFMNDHNFKLFIQKVRALSFLDSGNNLMLLIDGDKRNLPLLKSELNDYFDKSGNKSPLELANAYLDFYLTLKNCLNNETSWPMIKTSWNKNIDFFNTERISHNDFKNFLKVDLPEDSYAHYFNFVKIAQEKIAELLWNNFFLHPEKSTKIKNFVPDFFQFIDWHLSPKITTDKFVGLWEQKHFNNLSYASQIKGFDYFLENLFFKTPYQDNDCELLNEYTFINLGLIKTLNSKNINVDVLFKDNTLNLPTHLKEYLISNIEKFEKSGKKHSTLAFVKLDKLLTIYEKQKLESILIPKNTKTSKLKI